MNWKKVSLVGVIVLVLLGGLAMASSSTPQGTDGANAKAAKRYTRIGQPQATAAVAAVPQAMAEMAAPNSNVQLELVAPPNELPRANSSAMVTAVSPMVPAQTVSAQQFAPVASVKAATKATTKTVAKVAAAPQPAAKSRVQAKAAPAAAARPRNLFSYVRMLNYSPHPQEEVFLREKPLVLKDRKYYFSVQYQEHWNVLSDDEGHLNAIGFNINILENDKAVRTLKIPAAKIDAKKLKKGQILGVAEVAPFTFKIAVDSFTVKKKGVSDLTFKVDLIQ